MTKLDLNFLNALISEEVNAEPCTRETHADCEAYCLKEQLLRSDLKDYGFESAFVVTPLLEMIPAIALITQMFLIGMKYGQRMDTEKGYFARLEQEMKNGKP